MFLYGRKQGIDGFALDLVGRLPGVPARFIPGGEQPIAVAIDVRDDGAKTVDGVLPRRRQLGPFLGVTLVVLGADAFELFDGQAKGLIAAGDKFAHLRLVAVVGNGDVGVAAAIQLFQQRRKLCPGLLQFLVALTGRRLELVAALADELVARR